MAWSSSIVFYQFFILVYCTCSILYFSNHLVYTVNIISLTYTIELHEKHLITLSQFQNANSTYN